MINFARLVPNIANLLKILLQELIDIIVNNFGLLREVIMLY